MLPNTLTSLLQTLPRVSLGSGNFAAAETTLWSGEGRCAAMQADTVITDIDGVPRLKVVRRRAMYGHGRRDITDAKGNLLYSLAEPNLTLGRGIVGIDRDRGLRLSVQRTWGAAKVTTAVVEFRDTTGAIQLQGSMDSATVILEDGTPVARVSTQCQSRGIAAPRGSYFVDIAPGVDMPLAAALCLFFDECRA